MTTNNITSATIIIELDNGEYAATSTTSRAVIELSKSCEKTHVFQPWDESHLSNINIENF